MPTGDSPPSTRERILIAARKQLLQMGTGQLSLRAVATEANCCPATVSRLFVNKEGLLMALYREAVQQFEAHLLLAGDHPEPARRVAMLLDRYVQFGVQHPRQYELLFVAHLRGVPNHLLHGDNLLIESGWHVFERLVGQWLATTGRLELSISSLSLLLWSTAHGFLLTWLGQSSELFNYTHWKTILSVLTALVQGEC